VTDYNDILQEYALAPWSVLEQYRIEEILRYDHLSITYRAYNIKLDQLVTIKEFLPQDSVIRKSDDEIVAKFPSDEELFQKGLKHFIEEAEALATFSHPNIVRVLRCFRANGTAYMVMSHEDGETLQKQLERMGPDNTMPEDRIKLWLRNILDGLNAIHEKGICHKDTRPDAIFLKKDGSAMLIDFGAARYALNRESNNENAVSPSGYLSDDLYVDEREGGSWTDIYQLGALIYKCVTGQDPPDVQIRAKASANDEPDPILEPLKQAANRGYSSSFLDVIVLAMSLSMTDRRSAIEAFDKLKLASDELVAGEEKKEEVLDKGVGVPEPGETPVKEVPLDIGATVEASEAKEEEVGDKADVPEYVQIDDKKKSRGEDKRGNLLKVGLIVILVMVFLAAGFLVFLRPGLKVVSEPSASAVFLDGNHVGKTPLNIRMWMSGKHIISVTRKGYHDFEQRIEIHLGTTKKIYIELTPDVRLKSLCGSLMVKSSPSGATVFVDGKEKDVTPLYLENIKKGLHTVKVTKDCFSVVEEKVDITASKRTDLDVNLKSLCGSLMVKSSPSGATVFVDGKEKGVTPLHLDNIREGDLSVKLIKKGFETENKMITVKPSEKSNFSVNLRQPIVSPDGRFVDHRNGTVTDTKTGLMWMQQDSYVHLGRYLNWEQSRSYVNKLSTGGYSDWRLPTVAELKEIYEIKKSNTDKDGDIIHIDPIFSSGGTFWNWSSEEQDECCANVVLFIDGSVIKNNRMFSYERGVRAVRP
jgi:hypothetical protein